MNAHLLSRPEPLLFHLEPAGEALLEHPTELIELDAFVPAPPGQVSAFVADLAQSWRWMPGFLGVHFHTPHAFGEGATFDEVFNFMTIRMRVLRDDPGREWLATAEGCSLPVGERVVQRISYLDAVDRTHVRWQVAIDLPPSLAPFFPVVGPMFRGLFAKGLENLAQLDWSRLRATTPPAPAKECATS
ncbi:MAG: SRPBCC family protein [Myxococcota bacterium]